MEAKTNSKATLVQQAINFDDLNGEKVVVTHIETPEKFYSRLASDVNLFNEMNELIWSRVRSPFAEHLMPQSLEVDDEMLAYSTIHQIWCRSRVEEVIKGSDSKQSVKLYLIDFGSVEVVTYNNLRLTTDEIINFNSGQSFCFECQLSLIKPFSESQQWSSYANYLFKKQTKDKIITLKFDEYIDSVVVCDLSVQWPNDPDMCVLSMADYLVQTRVARYKMGHDFYHRVIPNAGPDYDHKNPNPEDLDYNSDEDFNIIDLKDENKLFYT